MFDSWFLTIFGWWFHFFVSLFKTIINHTNLGWWLQSLTWNCFLGSPTSYRCQNWLFATVLRLITKVVLLAVPGGWSWTRSRFVADCPGIFHLKMRQVNLRDICLFTFGGEKGTGGPLTCHLWVWTYWWILFWMWPWITQLLEFGTQCLWTRDMGSVFPTCGIQHGDPRFQGMGALAPPDSSATIHPVAVGPRVTRQLHPHHRRTSCQGDPVQTAVAAGIMALAEEWGTTVVFSVLVGTCGNPWHQKTIQKGWF